MKGKIINITRFCTDDGPGIRTTVFLKGCPLHCIWCHNPESQNPETEVYSDGEIIGKTVTPEEVFKEAVQDKVFYDTSGGGVTVSGGEPLFQPEFTAEVLGLCRKNGIHTAIETCGYANRQALQTVLKFCDLVLFDIKETDESKHLEYTGVGQRIILENLRQINDKQIPFVIRLPIIPGLNDKEEHFLKVNELPEKLEMCQKLQIMPYHKLGVYKYIKLGRKYMCSQIDEPTEQQIKKWQDLL